MRSEKIGWPAIALLHEALHLPDVRSLADEGEVFVVGRNARIRSAHGLAERRANVG
jgi:hypothetical protein